MDDQNVLGAELVPCSTDPATGYERDGCCGHHPQDLGRHEICAVMTEAFLSYSKAQGNDLVTPRPALQFPGLDPGDRWCVCIGRWVEAEEAGVAPPVVLEATNRTVLERIPRSTLEAHAHDGEAGEETDVSLGGVETGNGHRPETGVETDDGGRTGGDAEGGDESPF